MKLGAGIVHALSLVTFALGMVWTVDAQGGSIVFVHCGPACNNQVPQPNTDYIAVATGNYQTLGLRSNGSVVAWGFCGKQSCEVPVPNSGFTAIACGDAFNLFMREGGVIAVSGMDEYAQSDVPQPNSGYVAFAEGLVHAVALRSNGSIAAWGYCGPHVPEPNTDWIAVAAGGYSSMGLKCDGTLWKWGCFFEPGEIIAPGTRFKAMACHYQHALAIREDGSIFTWGNNDFGQLNVPEPNSGFVAVACTADSSVGLKADGTIVAWGHTGRVAEPNSNFISIATNNWDAYAIRSSACVNDSECDDGLACNGVETCVNGICQPGTPPCAPPLICRPSDGQCVQCLNNGHCDDGLFCNGVETCDGDGNCVPGIPPCAADQICDENYNMCIANGTDLWLCFAIATVVPGLGTVQNEDIVAWDTAAHTWSLVFDGSDVGLANAAIGGIARLPNGNILLSFTASISIPGLIGGPSGTSVDDSDIVRFTPTSLGTTTTGTFAFCFDGSDVGLTNSNEALSGIKVAPDGRLVLTTTGSFSATGASGDGKDLIIFNATSLGSVTSGQFALHFDGSDVGLSSNSENVDAVGFAQSGAALLSTEGNVSVPGVNAADEDVLGFTPSSLGSNTAGSFAMFFDGSSYGIAASANVSAVEIVETLPQTAFGGGVVMAAAVSGVTEFNLKNAIRMNDLLVVLHSWGACPSMSNATCVADATRNGVVDVEDLLFVLNIRK